MHTVILEELLAPMGREDSFYLYNPEEKILYIAVEHPIDTLESYRRKDISTAAFPFWLGQELKNEWEGFTAGVRHWQYVYALPFVLGDIREEASAMPEIEAEPYEKWANLFDAVQEGISQHRVEKVVASRRVTIHTKEKVNLPQLFSKLLAYNPTSFVFLFEEKGKAFVGATPEVLVEKHGENIRTFALAGTMAKDIDAHISEGQALLDDAKNRKEHQIVIDAIVQSMKLYCESVHVDPTGLLALRHVFHIKTDIRGQEKDQATILDWMKRLHPTPAMGGKPREEAMTLLEEKEPYQRGFFASPIGIIKDNGDGLLVVGIRSALVVEDKKIYAYAGCGIVDSSDCRSEYDEISRKLQTVVEAL